MFTSVLGNKKKSGDFRYCIECGCTTLVWREIWKTCAGCNAVYAKKDLISDDNTLESFLKGEIIYKTIESFIEDGIVLAEHSHDQEESKGFYFKNKALILIIPIFCLGICLGKTL